MRLFIAVTLPKEVKEYLSTVQDKLPPRGINKVKSMHLTLKFLGEVDEKKVDGIKKKLAKIKFPKFTAKLEGTGVFPTDSYIRVAWVGLEPMDRFIEIQQKIDKALEDDFDYDVKFHPHITLARVKFLENKKEFKDKIANIKIEPKEFEVSSFKLFESVLTKKGPVYEVLEEF